jgi:surface protein
LFLPFFVAPSLAVFRNAKAFNQDVSKWNVANVLNMGQMFVDADAFTQIWCETTWATKISDADFGGAGTGKLLCCSTGEFYNSTAFECESCPIGQYNDLTHVTDQLPLSCESCPRNKFAPIAGLPECSDCEEDQYR